MDLEEYKRRFAEDSSPGWEALNVSLRDVYDDQEPRHWGTLISHRLGGPDPLDGISAYLCDAGGIDHLHFVTFGYSSLYYDEDAVGGAFNKFGFEMTFRLASPLPPKEEPIWVCNLLQNLARYVFESGKWFDNYHWIPTNGPIRADDETEIVGLAFAYDPTLQAVDTPHGHVDFIQAFGITQSEVDSLRNKTKNCEQIINQHRKSNPLLITDLARKDG
jgi:hypothetical protein